MRRRLSVAVAVALIALAVPALAGAAIVGSTVLTVTPSHPGTRTHVVVRFAQPRIGGLIPGQVVREALQVTGPVRSGCVSGGDLTVAGGLAGTAVHAVLSPTRMGGSRWCTGVHRVALTIAMSSTCPVGPAQRICPQYMIAPMTVATASFRVSSR